MDSGKLNKRVEFWKAVSTQDPDTGTLSNTPVLQVATWAKVIVPESIGSSRAIEADETVFNDQVKFIIRKRLDFTPDKTMFIIHNGKKYIIHRVKDKEENNKPYIYITGTVQT